MVFKYLHFLKHRYLSNVVTRPWSQIKNSEEFIFELNIGRPNPLIFMATYFAVDTKKY